MFNFDSIEFRDTAVSRDLRVNFERLLSGERLKPDLAVALILALANSTKNQALMAWAEQHAEAAGLDAQLVQEAKDVAGIMGMLNMYYRFRHFLGESSAEYGSTGLRMTALAKPLMGKEKFETLALAVSIVNGCEKCVTSHEKALRDLGVSVDVLHDVARLSAVVKGMEVL